MSTGLQTATAVEHRRRRFSADEYYEMARAGVLRPDERVELIDGEIFVMSPIGPLHATAVDLLTRILVEGAADRAIVRVQNPVRLSDLSEPEPDLVLAAAREGGYRRGHPEPRDILLLVEVADCSRLFDRRIKMPLYAASAVTEVWLLDLAELRLLVHREPGREGYRDVRVATGSISPRRLPELKIDVDELLRSLGGE